MGVDGILPGYSQGRDIRLCHRCHTCNVSLVVYRDLVKAGRLGCKTGMGVDGILPGYSQGRDIRFCHLCHACNVPLVVHRDLVKAGRLGCKTGMGIDGIGILPGYSQSSDICLCYCCHVCNMSLVVYRDLIKTRRSGRERRVFRYCRRNIFNKCTFRTAGSRRDKQVFFSYFQIVTNNIHVPGSFAGQSGLSSGY